MAFVYKNDMYDQHMALLKAFQDKTNFESKYPDIDNAYRDNFQIYIRKKEKGFVSQQIHDLPLGAMKFKVSGPFGTGIALEPTNKTVVGITFGSGAVMFFDMMAYLLRYNIYKQSQKEGKSYMIFQNEKFIEFHPEFKFIFFCSFKTNESVLGKEIAEALLKFNRNYGFNNFEFVLRVSENKDPYFNENLFKKTFGNIADVSDVYFSTGLPGTEENLKQIMEKIGIDPNRLNSV